MGWETITTKKVAKELGVDFIELQAKHTLIEKIVKARTRKKLTQEQLVELIGKSQSWIAKVESGIGTKRVTFETLFKILFALGYEYKISTKKKMQGTEAA
jgi:transcriptional regulator with XRE-family HTH domain